MFSPRIAHECHEGGSGALKPLIGGWRAILSVRLGLARPSDSQVVSRGIPEQTYQSKALKNFPERIGVPEIGCRSAPRDIRSLN